MREEERDRGSAKALGQDLGSEFENLRGKWVWLERSEPGKDW